jgi:DNA-binding transcriptional MerR regulator
LLAKLPRTHANYRAYQAEAVRRVRFIKRAQELGFTLKEIEELLSLRAAPRSRCPSAWARRSQDPRY